MFGLIAQRKGKVLLLQKFYEYALTTRFLYNYIITHCLLQTY